MNERAIFDAASEIPNSARRRDYLDQACADNPALRTRVEALLESHESVRSFLDQPVADQLQAKPTQVRDHPTMASHVGNSPDDDERETEDQIDLSFLQPSAKADFLGKLAHYEVLQVLGHGGFGIVLKAFDEKLQRLVAIKVLNPQLAATSPPRKRFLREARATAKIRHENVVQIYSVDEQPIPFLVMEYIEGPTLQQQLDADGPLDISAVLQIGRQIASGLAAAHALGLIHRDIKPGNILLEQGPDQKAKITDFGLARTVDDASMTQSGVIAGTPMYMAPEQALGQTLDHRADLFSFGSVLYQMAGGRPPFRAATTIAVLRRVAEDTPRPLQEILPELPDWLVSIVARLHAKHPANRFQSAKEVADLLAQCQAELQLTGRVKIAATPEDHASCATIRSELPQPALPQKAIPEGRSSRKWLIALAVTSLAVLLGIFVFRFVTRDGTLVLNVEGPQPVVEVDGHQVAVKFDEKSGTYRVSVRPGGQHTLGVRAPDGASFTAPGQFSISPGGETKLTARLKKKGAPASEIDSDRAVAEWVFSVKGSVSGDDFIDIASLNGLPQGRVVLHGISLRNCNFNDSDLSRLQGLTQLVDLWLANSSVGDAGLEILGALSHLKRLSLVGTEVTDGGMADISRLHELMLLELSGTKVTNKGLAFLKGHANLTMFRLPPQTTNEGLRQLQGMSKLADLSLSHTQVTDAGLKHLQPLDELRTLYLNDTHVTDDGLKHLLELKHLDNLSLGHTPIMGSGFASLSQLPRLDLRYTPDLQFANLAKLKGVQELLLDFCNLNDEDLVHLKDLPRLESLSLMDNPISDQGLEHLRTIKSLKSIHLERTQVTEAGVAKLQAALPDCKLEK